MHLTPVEFNIVIMYLLADDIPTQFLKRDMPKMFHQTMVIFLINSGLRLPISLISA